MKNTIIIALGVILLGLGGYFLLSNSSDTTFQETDTQNGSEISESMQDNTEQDIVDQQNDSMEQKPQSVIGRSVEGREINAYHYGIGDTELLFVGGIHGGYSWNTSLVAYEMIDYLESNPSIIPQNVKVTVVPALNPDGLYKVTGKEGKFVSSDITVGQNSSARFNANDVDLNRNFDCKWQSVGKWQSRDVSGGSSAFSEPESQAIKNYVEGANPDVVVVWYSSAGGVFSSSCDNSVSSETAELTKNYADASGYDSFEEFTSYEITGDMVNWLAKNGIPGISVLLTDSDSTEWSKNRLGICSFLIL
jgi:hypothetical protein